MEHNLLYVPLLFIQVTKINEMRRHIATDDIECRTNMLLTMTAPISPPSCRRTPPLPAQRPSFPSGATSWKATPRPPPRSKPSWPRRLLPPAAMPRPPPGPGALDLRRAAVEPLGQGLRPRPHGLPPAHAGPGSDAARGHGRPREALQAGAAGSRQDLGHGGTAAVGHPRRLQGTGGQGTGALGDGPGHRCGQGPRRAEELNTVLDPAAGHFDVGGDSDRHLAGDPRPGPDERVLPHRLPGLGGGRGLRGAPRDRWRRALSPRHREAEQEAAEDPA